jgi:hypothetical protein
MDYQIQPMIESEIPIWWSLAQESEHIVKELIPDVRTFYEGFDTYMQAKIRQHEAFMAWKPGAGYTGIVAFSRRHNRITFLGVFDGYAYLEAGSPLLEFALQQLDRNKEITSTVIKGNHPRLAEERQLYEWYDFRAGEDTIEAGVPAVVMKRCCRLRKNEGFRDTVILVLRKAGCQHPRILTPACFESLAP